AGPNGRACAPRVSWPRSVSATAPGVMRTRRGGRCNRKGGAAPCRECLRGIERHEIPGCFPLRNRPARGQGQVRQAGHAPQEQLSGVKVYKVGEEAEKDVYLVGKTKDGQWAGLKTTVVET